MTKLLVAVLLVALAACPRPHPPVKTIDNQTKSSPEDAVIAPVSSTEWSVTITRHQGAKTADATVIVRAAPAAAARAPHAEVAAALAWLALARGAFDAGTFEDAIAAAKQGIDALGDNYRPKLAKDDTTIRIAMADEAISKGDVKTGASSLIAVLDARVYMYFMRYADTVRRRDP